ncbi:MAG: PAS domain S-box protein [bacterium]
MHYHQKSKSELIDALEHLQKTIAHLKKVDRDQQKTIQELSQTIQTQQEQIDQSKRTHSQLKQDEQTFRALVESMHEGVMQVNNENVIEFVNDRFCEIVGYKREEILGKNANMLLHSKSEYDLINEKINLRQKKQSDIYEICMKKKSGEAIWVQISGAPIEDQVGNVVGSIGLHTDITERKLAEIALKEKELLYRSLFERTSDAVFILDLSGNHIMVNQQAADMLGYSIEELKNKSLKDIAAPSHLADAKQKLKKLLAGESLPVYERNLIKKDGTKLPVEINAALVYDQNNQPVHIQSVVRDISERKRTESEIKKRIQQQEAVANLGHLALTGIGLDELMHHAVNLISQTLQIELCKILELLPDGKELLLQAGVGWQNGLVGHAKVSADTGSQAGYTLLSNEPVIVENLQKETRFRGPKLLFDHGVVSGMSVIIAGENRPYGVLGAHTTSTRTFTNNDVHFIQSVANVLAESIAHKKANDALRASEMKYRQLLESVPDGIYRSTPEGKFLMVNSAMVNMLGYDSHEELLKLDIPREVYFKPEERNEALDKLRKDKNKSNIFRLKKKDGSELWVEDHGRMVFNKKNQPIYYEGVLRDITESKRLKEELARSQRLETAGKVAAQIAHDFNNLLAPLTAYPALIREDLQDDHPVLDMVMEMETAAIEIAEINQQLLALGRRGHYSLEVIDLNLAVDNVLLSQNLPKQIIVEKELSEDLLRIKGGTAQITRALTNIIVNAREAMEDIGTLKIKTENIYLDEPLKGYQTVERGEYAKLEISDNGIGIEPEIFHRIFDPFFTTKKMDRMRGSGLGLSVVHGIVEDHHGYITIDSKFGQGTTFTVYFPTSKDLLLEDESFIIKSKGGTEKILFVDDDPVQRRVVKQLLHRLGYKVETLDCGEKATKHVKQKGYDLLILDMVMDGIDGTETYRQILEFKPEQKTIILSGYAMSERVQEALSLGADTFLSKPIQLNDLANAVRKVLDRP